ncbi:MAG TPA: hypothetical protein VE685_19290, partial [Thermoanaerobaculia bacterium]|nr:hypothetical protein [Thermoanaerobaculia bacterium]
MSIRLHTHGKPLAVFRRPVIGKVVLVPRESHNRGDYILVQRELPAEVDIKGYLGILIEETVSQEVPGFSIGPET